MSDIILMPSLTTWKDILLGVGPALIVGIVSIAVTRLSHRMEREKQIRELRIGKTEHCLRLVMNIDREMRKLKDIYYSGEDTAEGRDLLQKLKKDVDELRIQDLFYLQELETPVSLMGAPKYTTSCYVALTRFEMNWNPESRKHDIKKFSPEELEAFKYPYSSNPNPSCPFDGIWHHYEISNTALIRKIREYTVSLIQEPKTLVWYLQKGDRERFEKKKRKEYLKHDDEIYEAIQKYEKEREQRISAEMYYI